MLISYKNKCHRWVQKWSSKFPGQLKWNLIYQIDSCLVTIPVNEIVNLWVVSKKKL